MARTIYLLILVVVLNGCLAKTSDVETIAKNNSINADNITKAMDLINKYHKNDTTDALAKDMKKVAEEVFEDSIKSKGLTVSEDLPKTVRAVGSLSEMAGIPYGGIAMDLIAGLLGLFAGKKVADSRRAETEKRKEENEKWVKYLASLPPDEASKAIEINGV